MKYHPSFVPLNSGEVFGKWTVESYAGNGVYLCRCVCGVTKKICASTLRSGSRKACRSCSTRHPDSGFIEVLGTYRRNAKVRGLVFDISPDEARRLFLTECYYCGDQPSNETRGFVYNGIDRADNCIGYVLANCLPCCAVCNRIKHVLSYDEFLCHIKKILDRRG